MFFVIFWMKTSVSYVQSPFTWYCFLTHCDSLYANPPDCVSPWSILPSTASPILFIYFHAVLSQKEQFMWMVLCVPHVMSIFKMIFRDNEITDECNVSDTGHKFTTKTSMFVYHTDQALKTNFKEKGIDMSSLILSECLRKLGNHCHVKLHYARNQVSRQNHL